MWRFLNLRRHRTLQNTNKDKKNQTVKQLRNGSPHLLYINLTAARIWAWFLALLVSDNSRSLKKMIWGRCPPATPEEQFSARGLTWDSAEFLFIDICASDFMLTALLQSYKRCPKIGGPEPLLGVTLEGPKWSINQSINQREIYRAPLYDTFRSAISRSQL